MEEQVKPLFQIGDEAYLASCSQGTPRVTTYTIRGVLQVPGGKYTYLVGEDLRIIKSCGLDCNDELCDALVVPISQVRYFKDFEQAMEQAIHMSKR